MISEDLIKIKAEFDKDTVTFLRYLNENYVPAEKKIELTDNKIFCPTYIRENRVYRILSKR